MAQIVLKFNCVWSVSTGGVKLRVNRAQTARMISSRSVNHIRAVWGESNIAHLLAGVHIPQARRSSAWYRRYDLFVKCLISGFTPDWLKI